MTIKQWFSENFTASKPENEITIDGMESWGNQEISRAYFPTDRDGSLFVTCGGQCIVAFELTRIGGKAYPAYLVIEPSRFRDDKDSRDRLKLVQSA